MPRIAAQARQVFARLCNMCPFALAAADWCQLDGRLNEEKL